MATTSILSVKGWLGKVVIYVENPEKTRNPVYVEQKEITEEESQGLSDVIAYAVNEEKTRLKQRGKEIAEEVMVMQQYVSGVNCALATALSLIHIYTQYILLLNFMKRMKRINSKFSMNWKLI